MTNRERDLDTIRSLYGIDTPLGQALLNDVAGRWLLRMLPDDAIHELAEMHREAERRNASADRS